MSNLLPRAPFYRLVRQIAETYDHSVRFHQKALEAIQESTEAYIVGLSKPQNPKRYTINLNRTNQSMNGKSTFCNPSPMYSDPKIGVLDL